MLTQKNFSRLLITLRLIFRRFWPIYYIVLYIYMYIYIYTYIYIYCRNWEILFWEILLPSLGLINHIYDVINFLYYKHWTDKWKYTPYISVTHKVLKSCRSKMATLEHDVCDVHGHGASSLYIKTCWQSLYWVFPNGRMGDSPHQPKICSFTPSPPNF